MPDTENKSALIVIPPNVSNKDIAQIIPAQVIDVKARFNASNEIGAEYLTDIETIVKLGIMQGVSAVEFDPKGVTTRAQSAVVLINTLRTLGKLDLA
jgi:hypothetical protein